MLLRIFPEDYIAAVRLNYKPRKVWAVIGLFVVLLAVIAFVLGVRDIARGKGDIWDVIGLPAIAYPPLWYFVFLPRRIRKLYKQQRALHETHDVTFDEAGIATTYAFAKGVMPWSHVHKWRESEDLFLVYHSDAMFSIFPKRDFLPASDADRLREQLMLRVGSVDNTFNPNTLRGSA